jgi:integrase
MHGLYLRGDVWYCDVVYKGKRFREALCSDRKASELILAKKKIDLAMGKHFPNMRKEACPRFREVAEEYLKYAAARRKSVRRIANLMKKLVARFGDLRLDEIDRKMVEEYQADRARSVEIRDAVVRRVGNGWRAEYVRSDTGRRMRRTFPAEAEAEEHLRKLSSPLAVASKNPEIQLLRNAFTKAKEWNRIDDNPITGVRLLPGKIRRTRFLMPDEVGRLLRNSSEPLKSILTIAFHMGMRFGEIASMRRDKIDWATDTILLTDTKNGDTRGVLMDETVKAVLRAIPDRGVHYFPNSKGRPIGSVKRALGTALKRSGLTDFCFHDAPYLLSPRGDVGDRRTYFDHATKLPGDGDGSAGDFSNALRSLEKAHVAQW